MTRHHFGWSSQGVPGLQKHPVLGALFVEQKFLDNSSELMVIITATKSGLRPESDAVAGRPPLVFPLQLQRIPMNPH